MEKNGKECLLRVFLKGTQSRQPKIETMTVDITIYMKLTLVKSKFTGPVFSSAS